jgi:molybdopterin biosynthesis enzyme
MDKLPMIELNEALQIVLSAARPLGSERVELGDSLNRVLAEDVATDTDLPPFDKSLRDGYACRHADLCHVLTIVETIAAGALPTREIGPNQCAKIGGSGRAARPDSSCSNRPRPSPRIPSRSQAATQFIAREAKHAGAPSEGDAHPPQWRPHRLCPASCRPVAVIASGNELVPLRAGPVRSNTNGPRLMARSRTWDRSKDSALSGDAGRHQQSPEGGSGRERVVLISRRRSVGISISCRQCCGRTVRRCSKVAIKPGKPAVFVPGQTYSGLPNPLSTFVV